MSEKTHTQEFTVDENPNVVIGNIRGSVTVSPGANGVVSITAVERGSDERTRVEIGQDADGSIYARVKYDKTLQLLGLFGERPNKVDFTLTVPAQTDLKVDCVSAETHIHGLSGAIRLNSVSGEVHAEDLSGTLKLETVSGRIAASRLSGPLKLRTVSGSAAVAGSDLPSLDANTVSGSIDLETPIGPGPYEIGSVSGQVRIRTGERPSGRIHFKSVSGSASVDSSRLRASEVSNQAGSKKAVYTLSDEGPDIRFHSVSGSLKIITSQGEADAPPAAGNGSAEQAAPKAPSTDRMAILEKIASGEMSVDEAVRAMNE